MCYSIYKSASGNTESYYWFCIDKYHVGYKEYSNTDCSGTIVDQGNVSVSSIGGRWTNCGENIDCIAQFTSYESNDTGNYP